LKIKDALPIHAIKDGHRGIEVPLPRIIAKNNMILDHGRENSTLTKTSQETDWLRAPLV